MKLSEKMKRSKFARYESQLILELNLNGIDQHEDYDEVIKYFVSIVGKMPERSVPCLIDMTKVNCDEFVRKKIRKIYRDCSCHFNRSVMIADEESKMMLETVASGVSMVRPHIYTDINAARNYLASC